MNSAGVLTRFSPAEIRELYKHARIILHNEYMRLSRAPRTLDFARILIVIPRNVGSAVERNKLRRQTKNLFYTLKLHQGNFDYIIKFLPGARNMSFSELEQILISLVQI